MNEFVFSLVKSTYLVNNPKGYFLISKAPIRILQINKTLFSILEKVQDGISITEILRQYPESTLEQLLKVLLTLTYRGYCRIEKIAELAYYPRVSIIIPVRNFSKDLIDCVESIKQLDYPDDKLEVLVVEDGFQAHFENFSYLQVKHIRLEESRGPGAARNAGAGQATGEILAYLDADCVADKNWLKEIISFFSIQGTGVVGGFVGGYYNKSHLDRYEDVSSSLSLGPRILFEGNTDSVLYVPTCNMLVKKDIFEAAGGFKDGMRVGEDVDFCWKVRKLGYSVIYAPFGKVSHRHRNDLWKMLRRRSDYGTSEGILYRSHKDKRKKFIIPVWAALSFLALTIAILLKMPYPLAFIPIPIGFEFYKKSSALRRYNIAFSFKQISFSTFRNHFSFYYAISFHLVRYYLILLLVLGFSFPQMWFFCIFILLLTSAVDFISRKPELIYPVFLYFYILEHLAYQIGVFWGCLKFKYFKSYIPIFKQTISS